MGLDIHAWARDREQAPDITYLDSPPVSLVLTHVALAVHRARVELPFADELGLPFEHQLENPHVINAPAQLLVATFPKGPSGHELTSSYAQREASANKLDLGNALVNFARIVTPTAPSAIRPARRPPSSLNAA